MALAIHVHLVLLVCLAWFVTVVASVFSAPIGALFGVSTCAQFLVFAYGILLYRSWLTSSPSRWLRPVFWWLPQTLFYTTFEYDPLRKVLGKPTGGFCAVMPLQASASAGWHLDHSSVAVGLNLLAAACAVWAASLPNVQLATGQSAPNLRFRSVRRALTGFLLVTPALILLASALVRGKGITTWIKAAPPRGLEQVVLASGRVVPVVSVAPVRLEGGGSLLLLEYFTDLPPSNQGAELAAEEHEIWQQFRPFVEKAGYETAVIAAIARPAGPIYVAPHLKKVGWSRDSAGRWGEIIPESQR
jgi:hypothetical protein